MFQSKTKLPHILAPDRYCSQSACRSEMDVLRDGWHVVGTTRELANHGDFLTCDILGTAVQVRNFSGTIKALSNICAHRHSLLCSAAAGNSPKMKCQYHGWEYQSDGMTARIPQPKNFAPVDREATCLPGYHVELVGQLVFICVAEEPKGIDQFLGDEFSSFLAERFGEQWNMALKWQPEYPVNWKIPIENSLESYHVPAVHPKTFREDPGGDRTDHLLSDTRTSMETSLPFCQHGRIDAMFQKMESRLIRWLGYDSTDSYSQHHVFPNLLFSFTDAISLVQCIIPTGPRHSVATVRQFSRLPERGGAARTVIARIWGKLKAAITKKVLLEDLEMFSAIQTGLSRSQQAGVLGICEERIHRFQNYIQRKTND